MKRAIAFTSNKRLAAALRIGGQRRRAAVLRIGIAAVAVTLALTGCGVRDRIASQSHPVGRPATTSDASTQSTGSAGSATGTPTSGDAATTSTAAELSSVDRALSGIGSTLSGVDSQITQADKAADSDN